MKIIFLRFQRSEMNPDHWKDGGPGTSDPNLGSNESFLFLYRYYEKTSEKILVGYESFDWNYRLSLIRFKEKFHFNIQTMNVIAPPPLHSNKEHSIKGFLFIVQVSYCMLSICSPFVSVSSRFIIES